MRLMGLYGGLLLLFVGSWVGLSPEPVSGLESFNVTAVSRAFEKADDAMGRGDFDEVLRVLEPVPVVGNTLLLRGRAEIGAGRLEAAEKSLAGVTRGDVHSARYKRALALWWSDDTDAAVVQLDEMIDRPGGNLLGEATALRAHLSGTRRVPQSVSPERKKGRVAKAKAKVRAGWFADAIPILRGNASSDGLAALYLGKAHLGLGQLEEAHAAFSDCAKNHSSDARKCRYKAAITSMLLGREERARDEVAMAQGGPLAAEAAGLRRFLQ